MPPAGYHQLSVTDEGPPVQLFQVLPEPLGHRLGLLAHLTLRTHVQVRHNQGVRHNGRDGHQGDGGWVGLGCIRVLWMGLQFKAVG